MLLCTVCVKNRFAMQIRNSQGSSKHAQKFRKDPSIILRSEDRTVHHVTPGSLLHALLYSLQYRSAWRIRIVPWDRARKACGILGRSLTCMQLILVFTNVSKQAGYHWRKHIIDTPGIHGTSRLAACFAPLQICTHIQQKSVKPLGITAFLSERQPQLLVSRIQPVELEESHLCLRVSSVEELCVWIFFPPLSRILSGVSLPDDDRRCVSRDWRERTDQNPSSF